MAITLPSYYVFTQNNNAIIYDDNIRTKQVTMLRDNEHYLYANLGLKTTSNIYWANGLKTNATSDELVLEIPYTFSPDRKAMGLTCIFYRTGVVTLTIVARDVGDTTTLDSFGPSTAGAGEAFGSLTAGFSADSILLKVYLRVSSGNEGLNYLKITEIPLDLANLPG